MLNPELEDVRECSPMEVINCSMPFSKALKSKPAPPPPKNPEKERKKDLQLKDKLNRRKQACIKTGKKNCDSLKSDESKNEESLTNEAQKTLDTCSDRCPFSCHVDRYNAELSYASFPSNVASQMWAKYLKIDGNNDGDFYLRRNLIGINIYFTKRTYLEMKEKKVFDIFQLFSDLGGQMGLWMGISVITIVEFISKLQKNA